MEKTHKITIIGGGTGTFTLLTGLKEYLDLDISAIMTMADDGGSNKVLRDEFGLLPTSGIRQAIIALSKDTTLLRRLFEYRFHQGTGISGMTFGNLFMAAVADIVKSQKNAITQTCELLGVRGHVLPVSYEHTSLVATYQDGTEVLGEHYIDMSNSKVAKQRLVNLRSIPQIKIDEDARKAIMTADMIILGPGDLYTNTIANLIVRGVSEAIEESHAKLIFVMNLMNRPGETYGYRASDFLTDLSQYLNPDRLDFVLLNSDLSLSPTILKKYLVEGSSLVEDDLESAWHQTKIIRTKLLSHYAPPRQKGDKLIRSMARHDPSLLAKVIYEL